MTPSDPRPRREARSSSRIRADVEEEIRLHLELRAAELEAEGWNPEAARGEALRRFGDLTATQRECVASDRREEGSLRRRAFLEDLWQDLTYGVRVLKARPRFTLPILAMLAVAIGSATAILGAADHVLFRPLPYRDPDRVVTLWERDQKAAEGRRPVSPGNLIEWKRRSRSFSAMGVAEPSGVDETSVVPPVPIRTWQVSDGFLQALAPALAEGRLFTPEEYSGGHRVVIVSNEFRRRRFGADARAIGRTLELDRVRYRIVGVLPAGMDYPERKDLWLPKAFRPDELLDRESSYMDAVARLAPGVTAAQARAELDDVGRQLAAEYRTTNADVGIDAVPIAEHLFSRVRTAFVALLIAVLAMLLLACANVAGLMLARGIEREREMGIRQALGADRSRLVRQLLTEALVLAGVGGAAGVVLAWAGTRWLVTSGPAWLPRVSTLGVDGRVLAMAVAITAAAAILFGLLPALRFSAVHAGSLLVGAHATRGRRGTRLHRVLVVGQIAVALVLLTGTSLLARSSVRLLANDPGFAVRDRAAIQLFLWDRNPTAAARLQRAHEIVERWRQVPGVQDVGLVSALPFHPSQIDAQSAMEIEGAPAEDVAPRRVYTTIASPEYFRVMRIPMLAGRLFDRQDRAGTRGVAVINRTLARRYFPHENPIGKRIRVGVMDAPQTWEIVGVVGDVRPTGLDSDPRPEVYVPFEQTANGSVTFVASTTGNAERVLPVLIDRIVAIDPRQTVYHSDTVAGLIDRSMVERRFYLFLMGLFSTVCLILAAIGIYSLMNMTTASRTREIGVRLALGARPTDIVRMILADGARLIVGGLAVGALGAMWFGHGLRSMLYGADAVDPSTLALVAAGLFAVAIVAVGIPALRSSRIDPMTILRHE